LFGDDGEVDREQPEVPAFGEGRVDRHDVAVGAEHILGHRLEVVEQGQVLPLDIGYTDTVPAGIRTAVILRDQHCQWTDETGIFVALALTLAGFRLWIRRRRLS
jgi:hypothetical protein